MHNKFVIIDANHSNPNKAIVWTGATNWQEGQINHDPNNVVIFQDQSLAKAYTLEFNEMWGSNGPNPSLANSRFGPTKTDNTPHEFNIGGKRVECYFSPSDNVNNKLTNTINTADNSMYFASMVITRFDLAQAITDKVAAGVNAYGLTHSAVGSLTWNDLVNGMQPGHMLANADSANSIMHHKYLIVDQENNSSDPQVWTGSHNWSNNANNKNDENTVVIHDQNVANQFYQEFYARFIQNGGVVLNTITPQNSSNEITIYPNPNNQNVLGVSLNKEVIEGSINMFNLQGQLISSQAIVAENGTKQFNLNIEHLGTGVYFIEFNLNGNREVKRLVKL
jgi:phosphatidylserine/phosphatidylglycerophosphate/cardiolipin synthase-like enzyme